MFAITSIYAGVLAILLVVLSMRVVNVRKAERVSLGHGESGLLLKRVRSHANCAEYAPLGIILIGLVEAQGAPAAAVHALGLALVASRLLHPFAIEKTNFKLRTISMATTFGVLITAGAGLILHGLF